MVFSLQKVFSLYEFKILEKNARLQRLLHKSVVLCKQSNAWCGILLTASCLWESPNLWRVLIWYLIIFTDLFWWNLILKTVTNFIFARNCLWLSTIMLFCTIVLYMLSFGSWLITEKVSNLGWKNLTRLGHFQPNQSVNILWVCTKLKSSIENPLLKVEIKC